MSNEQPTEDPGVEDEQEFEPGIDGCHHGIGFDEDCERCNEETEDDE